MQPDKNISDLDYLAELGFEKIKVSNEDVNDLKKKVRERSVSYNSGLYFGFISLLAGAFIGVSVFFLYYNSPVIYPAPKTIAKKEIKSEEVLTAPTILDTVKITAENFIYSPVAPVAKSIQEESIPALTDTAVMLPSKPLIIPSQTDKLQEIQIKYIPNAPIVFLHDLKITNYNSLYFKKNKFISLSSPGGLDPSFSNKEEFRKNDNVMMPAANYYLHEAISEAMFYFSKRDYNRCLRTLQVVQEINPDDINCHFYSGMCYYYKKNFAAAIKNFESCIANNNNTFLTEAQYYKAMSLHEQGNKSEANEQFEKIANEGGFYAEKAKAFLQ